MIHPRVFNFFSDFDPAFWSGVMIALGYCLGVIAFVSLVGFLLGVVEMVVPLVVFAASVFCFLSVPRLAGSLN